MRENCVPGGRAEIAPHKLIRALQAHKCTWCKNSALHPWSDGFFLKSMKCIPLKTSHNQALFERKVVIVHFYLKQPTSTPMSPSVLTNAIKSEWANCMCEGSWEALWRRWWRSDVVILFPGVNTNVFHGLHLCRLWFTRLQQVVFELLLLIRATSPDSLKIPAVFKIVEETLNNCPQANMNHPCLPLTSLLNSRYKVGSFPVRSVRMRQHHVLECAEYSTADWRQF